MNAAEWRLDVIEERIEYLRGKLAAPLKDSRMTYTRNELAALTWALGILRPLVAGILDPSADEFGGARRGHRGSDPRQRRPERDATSPTTTTETGD
jgi:hypothetical protein